MKNLILLGAGGYGREIYDLALQCSGFNKEYQIKGFLDDNLEALDGYDNYAPIISKINDYQIEKNDVFACSIGSIKWKKYACEMIKNKGGKFINLIHPTVAINSNVSIGEGIIICTSSAINSDCVIEDFVTIQGFVTLGHDTKVGKWSHINTYSFTGGFSFLEEEVSLHTRATILPGITIGKKSTVGAMSLVIKNVKDGVSVFGIPAKKIDF